MFPAVSRTIADMESDNRKRLGHAVVARRTDLGMRTTKALAELADLSPRMLGDVENGRRDNFSPGAKAQIERALQWEPGSIDAVLAGGDPTPMPSPPRPVTDEADYKRALEYARHVVNAPPTPHDTHFERAERLLAHAHEAVRQGDHLGAIHGLEGVWSTVELLVDRITDAANLLDKKRRDSSSSRASVEAPQGQEVNRSPDQGEPGSVAGIEATASAATVELQIEDGNESGQKSS